MSRKVRVALVGVGNCASSLVQGVSYYADPANGTAGLIHDSIGVPPTDELISPTGTPSD